MEIFKRSRSLLSKGFLLLCLVAPMAISCSDVKELREEIDEIKVRLDSLENGLNGQIEAMAALLGGGDITIAECKKNDNGSYTITLSNGATFTVLHGSAQSMPLLSFVIEGNVKYWAVYDAEGVLVPLTDGAGKKIPVSRAVPTVVEKDGAYYLVIDGKEYLTGYGKDDNVSVITDYVVNEDESGNVYSVTFKIGDETFTLSVDSYKGFTFMLGSAQIGGTVIKDLYVAHGSTYRVTAGLDGVVDYVMQVPDGWRVKEVVSSESDELYLDITAPAKETVASGAAVDAGDLKVVAVVEGGDAMVAKLELSTTPFKTFKATATNAVIEKYNGVEKFLYGLVKEEDYDEAKIFAGASAMLSANDKGVSETNINAPLSEILGSGIVAGESYVLWAIPAFYDLSDADGAYYVVEGLIMTSTFGGTVIIQEVTDLMFNDATLTFSLSGPKSYYGGTCELTDAALTEIMFRINNGMDEPLTEPLTYSGSVFDFPNEEVAGTVAVKPNVPYITWVIPCFEGKDQYSLEDMVSKEFILPEVTEGGQIEVLPGTAEVGKVNISVPLIATGASRIYYLYMKTSSAGRYKTEKARANYLLSNGKFVDGDSVVVNDEGLAPGTKRSLFAMAVDATGKYGQVKVVEFVTDNLTYNDIEVTLTAATVGQSTATVNVKATGSPVKYVYWAGKQTEEFWLALEGANATEKAASAQELLALYPDNDDVRKAMRAFPLSGGVLNMTGLKGNAVYSVVMVAVDAEGNCSQAGHVQFNTLAVDLGTIVTSDSDTWKAAKNKVVINWHEEKFTAAPSSLLSAFYAFDIKVPSDLTAYILCMSEDYFQRNPDTQTLEDRIVDVEMQCSRKYDKDRPIWGPDGELLCEPDWVDDDGNLREGTLLNVYDFYVHGFPTNGFVTYFAKGSHGAHNCTEWEVGACGNYKYASESISKRLSLDYYKELIKGRGAKMQSVIDKAAQDYYDAYYPYYKDAVPLIYENNGEALYMENHYASGPNSDNEVIDDVIVVFKDAQGNYYEPMFFDVPNSFK